MTPLCGAPFPESATEFYPAVDARPRDGDDTPPEATSSRHFLREASVRISLELVALRIGIAASFVGTLPLRLSLAPYLFRQDDRSSKRDDAADRAGDECCPYLDRGHAIAYGQKDTECARWHRCQHHCDTRLLAVQKQNGQGTRQQRLKNVLHGDAESDAAVEPEGLQSGTETHLRRRDRPAPGRCRARAAAISRRVISAAQRLERSRWASAMRAEGR